MRCCLSVLAGLAVMLPALAIGESALRLTYRVDEPGLDPYLSRILVTDDYLRMDEGAAGGGFLLLDRHQGIVYSVSDVEKSVLVINPSPGHQTPSPSLVLTEEVELDAEAPAIGGRQPYSVALLVNGERCREMVVVKGLLPEAVEALREFSEILARVQARSLTAMPGDVAADCDLAELVYAPTRWLDFGLPIQWRYAGKQQFLLDFAAAEAVETPLFQIPPNYARMGMPGQ